MHACHHQRACAALNHQASKPRVHPAHAARLVLIHASFLCTDAPQCCPTCNTATLLLATTQHLLLHNTELRYVGDTAA